MRRAVTGIRGPKQSRSRLRTHSPTNGSVLLPPASTEPSFTACPTRVPTSTSLLVFDFYFVFLAFLLTVARSRRFLLRCRRAVC